MKRVLTTLLVVCFCAELLTAAPAASKAKENKRAQQKKESLEWLGRVKENYMFSQHDKLVEEMRKYGKQKRNLSREDAKELSYIRKASNVHRPKWWSKCGSSSNISFRARIWNKNFTANYMPSTAIGFQAPVGIKNGKIQIIVSWRPSMVGNPNPANGKLAKKHKLSKGDLQEAIIWHELGHNYVTYFLPIRHVIELYNNHYMLFEKLQEFYADLTSLYHGSPRSRLAAMFLRLSVFKHYDETECHTRAAHAIGSLIVTEMLANPSKWPSILFPPKVPEKNIERETIQYVYRNIDTKWTLAEDRQLREFIYKFIKKKGDSILKKRGTIPLTDKLAFKLMVGEDRKLQNKRDAWVAEKLKGLIASGRADKPAKEGEKGATTKPVGKTRRVIIIDSPEVDDIELD